MGGTGGASVTATGSGGGTGGMGGTGGASSSTGGGSSCLPPDVLGLMQAHLDDLDATAGLMAGHPGELEATGFFLAPGLPRPPAVSNVFAGPLIQVCSAPMFYDPYCEEGRCSRIECTGDGAGWIFHFYLQTEPFQSGGWSFAHANVDIAWADGATGVTFTIDVAATGPANHDWTLSGTGAMDTAQLDVTESFPSLFAAGASTLTYTDTPQGFTGALVVAGVTVATADAQGKLQPTGNCPP